MWEDVNMAEKMPAKFKNNAAETIYEIINKITDMANRTVHAVNSFELPLSDIAVKTAAKCAITVAALLSIAVMIFSGADLSPSAISQGIKDKMALCNAAGEGYPFDVEGSRIISVDGISNATALLTDTNYTVLDKDGREVLSEAHYMVSPIIKTAGRYTLLLDQRSTDFNLKTLSGSIYSGKTDNSIITGDVSRSGRFAIVTKHDTSNAYVYVFSKSGSVLHRWKSSTYHISDITINPSGSLIAMCGVTTDENGQLKSCVIVQKVGGSSNLREYIFDGTLIFNVQFTDSDKIAAIGDDMAARLSVNVDKKLTYSYNDRTLNEFDISDNGNIALVLSNHSDGQNAIVTVINSSCHEVVNLETSLNSPSVELTNNRINLIGQSKLYVYNLKGQSVKSVNIPADSQSVVTSGGKPLIKGVSTITKAYS